MKEQLFTLTRNTTPVLALNLAREYLQARILSVMQDAGAMIPLAFQGGTSLRFLYDLPRFSEDLDFALERPHRSGFDIEALARPLAAQLEREGYDIVTNPREAQAVHSLMVGFPGLLHEAGLSPHASLRLRIRIEVDMNPPAGATLETTLVRRHALLNLQHHDRASLLAGKLHALLQRQWTKGRDLFDLFWYLSDPRWPGPNLVLLNNALEQTGWSGPRLDGDAWIITTRERVTALDWTAAERDVRPFLEPGALEALFSRDNLLQVLDARRASD